MAKRKPKPTPAPDTPISPTAETVYRGRRTSGAAVSVVENGVERPLDLRLDLARHSPTGFGWGYAGSGPAQLALALAADALGDDARAKRVYQRLKLDVVAGLPSDGWELTATQVQSAIAAIERGRGATPADPTAMPATSEPAPLPPAVDTPAPPAPTSSPEPAPARAAEPPPLPARPVVIHPPEANPDPADRSPSDCESDGRTHAAAVRPDGPRVPNPYGYRSDAAAGVRLLEDRRFRQLQLAFADTPPEAVRQAVADAGWRWRPHERHWTKQISPETGWQTRADADRLFDYVVSMLRAEAGVGVEPG